MGVQDAESLVIELEQALWAAVLRKDGEKLASCFSDDYVEVTLDGVRVEKQTIVSESPKVDEISRYKMDDACVVRLSDDCMLLIYHLTLEGTCRGVPIEPRERWATSIWSMIDDRWQCRFFQQTSYSPSGKLE